MGGLSLSQVCFGPMVPSVVITAMKAGSAVAAVKLLLCLNLLCTFPLIVRGAFQVSVRDTQRERGGESIS